MDTEYTIPEELKHTHVAIQQVHSMAIGSMSPDEFEKLEQLLVILSNRRNGL